jgi:hypothetical protein
MKVIDGGFGKQAPDDLADELRQLADAVDRGDISGMIMAYVYKGDYSFAFGTSKAESILLAALMQQQSIDRMRA